MTALRLTEAHAAEMAALEKLCFSLPWSENTIRAELKSPISAYWGVFDGGRLIGYAGLQSPAGEGYITNVAAAPDRRRQGVADTLMREILDYAGARELDFLTLEVRESNTPARGLYEKYGFFIAGKRKGYYEKPREDAILMTRILR